MKIENSYKRIRATDRMSKSPKHKVTACQNDPKVLFEPISVHL